MSSTWNERQRYVHYILLETMESRLKWSLPESEVHRTALSINEKWADLFRDKGTKKEFIRKSRLFREKLRNLNHQNAKLFASKFIFDKRSYQVVIKAADDEVQLILYLATMVQDYNLSLYRNLLGLSTSGSFPILEVSIYSSNAHPDLITLLYLLRDPQNIHFHPECKYAYPT